MTLPDDRRGKPGWRGDARGSAILLAILGLLVCLAACGDSAGHPVGSGGPEGDARVAAPEGAEEEVQRLVRAHDRLHQRLRTALMASEQWEIAGRMRPLRDALLEQLEASSSLDGRVALQSLRDTMHGVDVAEDACLEALVRIEEARWVDPSWLAGRVALEGQQVEARFVAYGRGADALLEAHEQVRRAIEEGLAKLATADHLARRFLEGLARVMPGTRERRVWHVRHADLLIDQLAMLADEQTYELDESAGVRFFSLEDQRTWAELMARGDAVRDQARARRIASGAVR